MTISPKILDQIRDWSDQDKEWLAQVNEDFQDIAVKYGRTVFALTVTSGYIAGSCDVLAPAVAGKESLLAEIEKIRGYSGQIITACLTFAGIHPEKFNACRSDIQVRISFVHGAGEKKKSSAGIVLAS